MAVGIGAIVGAVSTVIDGVTGVVKGRQEVKAAGITAEAKLKRAQLEKEYKLELTELEIQALEKRNQQGSIKDEVALITGISPYWLIVVGAIYGAFGHPEVSVGVADALTQLKDLGVPVGEIVMVSIAAGLGVRLLKK